MIHTAETATTADCCCNIQQYENTGTVATTEEMAIIALKLKQKTYNS